MFNSKEFILIRILDPNTQEVTCDFINRQLIKRINIFKNPTSGDLTIYIYMVEQKGTNDRIDLQGVDAFNFLKEYAQLDLRWLMSETMWEKYGK